MYQFWYDHLKEKYDNKVELIYTDADSFIVQVETDDIYIDILEDKNLYDFSKYPTNHPNYNIINKKVLGKFKNELKSKIITEFIGLKPKMYLFDYIDNYIILNKCNKCEKSILLKCDEVYKYEYNEYNNMIINENDKRIVLKYDQYNNIIVNNNIRKRIEKLISLKHDEYKRSL